MFNSMLSSSPIGSTFFIQNKQAESGSAGVRKGREKKEKKEQENIKEKI